MTLPLCLPLSTCHFLPNSSPPDTRPSRAIKSTEKGTEWQAQLLHTHEKARLRRQTPAGKAAVDAAASLTAHAVTPADEYFSLESLDSLMITSYPTVFLTQSFPYRSLAPCVWDLTKPPVTFQEALARPDCDA